MMSLNYQIKAKRGRELLWGPSIANRAIQGMGVLPFFLFSFLATHRAWCSPSFDGKIGGRKRARARAPKSPPIAIIASTPQFHFNKTLFLLKPSLSLVFLTSNHYTPGRNFLQSQNFTSKPYSRCLPSLRLPSPRKSLALSPRPASSDSTPSSMLVPFTLSSTTTSPMATSMCPKSLSLSCERI